MGMGSRIRERRRELGLSQDELALLEPKAKKLRKSMNRIYELVEDGAADEYDVQRLRGLQSQLHIVDAKIKEVTAKRNVSAVTEKDVRKFIKERYVPFIRKNSAENNFRAIIEELIDRIEVDENNVTIHYKLAYEWCDWGQPFHALTFTDIFSRSALAG